MSSMLVSRVSGIGQAVPKDWWIVLLRGMIACILGFLSFGNPYIALWVAAIALGIFAIIGGAINVIAAMRSRPDNPRWWLVLGRGMLLIVVGMFILGAPWLGITLAVGVVVMLLGLAFVVAGAIDIFAAFRVRKEIDNEWSIIASGTFAVLLGLVFATTPWLFGSIFVVVLGGFLLVFGVLQIVSAFRLRKLSLQGSKITQEE
jgi:uncharacterized membrane protein HdeD (DUF308 family)